MKEYPLRLSLVSNCPDPSALAYAHGEPTLKGVLRARPDDFQVAEIPAIEPSGEGEHCLVRIRKTNLNTADVAQQLAKLAGLPLAAVSWAGLKDRVAVTEQTFSVHLAARPEPEWSQLDSGQVKVLDVNRHQRKLKTGVLKGNRFVIRVTQLEGGRDSLEQRYQAVLENGVPNYFGEQRFGRHGGNLQKAIAMFGNPKKRIKRHLRSIYLSAARSFLFNAVLDQRVRDGSWNQLLPGEICMLHDSHSIFHADSDPMLQQRLVGFDIHPTGPLWGEGEIPCKEQCRELEQSVIEHYPEYAKGLEKARLKQERRALRLVPRDFEMQTSSDSITLSFELPPGAYATSVVRELIYDR